jgi:FkbM family methyltransferase
MQAILLVVLTFLLSKVECNQYPPRFEGFFSEYAENRFELIAKFLPENPVIFEAGGHYGNETVSFAKRWPKGTIISFEPNPHAFELFLQKTQGYPNIHGFQLAVSDYEGTALLHVCYGTTGDNPIYEGASSLLVPSEFMKIHYQGPKVEVPCVVLDDWCRKNDIAALDFMWLDLEGLELQVLKSSPKILETVKAIYTETNFMEFRKGMTQYRDLKKFLEESGFRLVSHWYLEGLQGDALFVKKELFYLGFF